MSRSFSGVNRACIQVDRELLKWGLVVSGYKWDQEEGCI